MGSGWTSFDPDKNNLITLDVLAAHPGFDRPVDRNALALYFRHKYVPAPWTIREGIFKLEPGCKVQVTADGAVGEPEQYWSYYDVVERGATFSGTAEDAVDELDRLLRRSVSTMEGGSPDAWPRRLSRSGTVSRAALPPRGTLRPRWSPGTSLTRPASRLSTASYTVPIPPRPSSLTNRYCFTCVRRRGSDGFVMLQPILVPRVLQQIANAAPAGGTDWPF